MKPAHVTMLNGSSQDGFHHKDNLHPQSLSRLANVQNQTSLPAELCWCLGSRNEPAHPPSPLGHLQAVQQKPAQQNEEMGWDSRMAGLFSKMLILVIFQR